MNESKDENKKTNNNEKLVLRIDARERALREQNAMLEAAEEKGVEKGIEKGEKNKVIEIAKNLKNMKLDIKQIIEATGLTKEEIESL